MIKAKFLPYPDFEELSAEEMLERSAAFYAHIRRRRSVRDFSSRPVARVLIENCLLAAGTAPNGANMQPWYFVAISDSEVKHEIRVAAEEEEIEFYSKRAPQEWLDALQPLGTDEHKPFLEIAPWLIAIFAQSHGVLPDGRRVKNYYVQESVGIATGLLIAALHQTGLATLTHTPSPMGFLNKILDRPKNERPFLLLVVGYPEKNAKVPIITKKALNEIAAFI